MNNGISHLTHQSITDHLAIARGHFDNIRYNALVNLRSCQGTKKIKEEVIYETMKATFAYLQQLADLRRENATDGK